MSAGLAVDTSMVFDYATPYVAFTDYGTSQKATVMKYNGTNWVLVGSAGFSDGTTFYSKLSIDNGVPHVVYTDSANSNQVTVMNYNDGTLGTTDISSNIKLSQIQLLII